MDANGVMNSTAMQRKYRSKYDNPRPKSQLQSAKDFLKRELDNGAVVLTKTLREKAKEEGVGWSYMDEAKRQLKIVSERWPGDRTQWTWRLPTESEVAPAATVGKEATVDPARTHHLCEDEFSLTVEERERYGIRPDEQVCWIRDPNYWKGKVPGDPVRIFMRDNEGGRVILDGGEFVTNGIDTILAVRAMSGVEDLRAREQAEARKIDRERDNLHDDDFDRRTEAELRERMMRNTREHLNMGLIGPGSPSSGLPYEDYVKYRGLSKEDIKREELQYSLRGASREFSEEEMSEIIASQRRAGGRGNRESGGGSGKTYSIPANVRPRNLAAR